MSGKCNAYLSGLLRAIFAARRWNYAERSPSNFYIWSKIPRLCIPGHTSGMQIGRNIQPKDYFAIGLTEFWYSSSCSIRSDLDLLNIRSAAWQEGSISFSGRHPMRRVWCIQSCFHTTTEIYIRKALLGVISRVRPPSNVGGGGYLRCDAWAGNSISD